MAASSPPATAPSVGFSWSLLSTSMPDGSVVDAWMADVHEHFIMKADLQIITYKGMQAHQKNRTVCLTEESWIELKCFEGNAVEPPALPPPTSPALVLPAREKKHKSLLEIHSLDLDAKDPTCFRINFFSGSASSKAKAGFSKMKRFLQVSSSFEDFLKTKVVKCHSAEEAFQWKFVIEKLISAMWQKKLEQAFLPNMEEHYKRHAFVIKQHNDRLLLLTNAWFYNVEVSYKPIALKSIKWAIPVSSFSSVTQSAGKESTESEGALMTISFDAEEAKKQFDSHHRNNKQKDLVNKHHEFIFRTKDERQKFVNSLAAVYWQVTRKKLQTEIK